MRKVASGLGNVKKMRAKKKWRAAPRGKRMAMVPHHGLLRYFEVLLRNQPKEDEDDRDDEQEQADGVSVRRGGCQGWGYLRRDADVRSVSAAGNASMTIMQTTSSEFLRGESVIGATSPPRGRDGTGEEL